MSLGYPFSAFVVGVVTSTYLTLKTGAVIGKRSDLFSFPRPNDVKYEKNYHQVYLIVYYYDHRVFLHQCLSIGFAR